MPSVLMDITQYEVHSLVNSDIKQSHTVDKGKIPESETFWYRKEMESPAKARREWFAQEFLRLIIPNQTETRLASNLATNTYYILSKEIPNFQHLPEGRKKCFTDGTYTGLGNVIMGAYFIHEADLKNGNIGISPENIVYKIDGDWAFASMRSFQFPADSAKITLFQLKKLPFPYAYKTHNWLDLVIEGTYYQHSDIIDEPVLSNSYFKKEQYETMFKLLLLPDYYIDQFVGAFFPAGAKQYSDFLINRHKELHIQALKYYDFVEYVKTHSLEMQKLSESFFTNMFNFVVNGTYKVISEDSTSQFIKEAQMQQMEVFNSLGINKSLGQAVETLAENTSSDISKPNHLFFSNTKINSSTHQDDKQAESISKVHALP